MLSNFLELAIYDYIDILFKNIFIRNMIPNVEENSFGKMNQFHQRFLRLQTQRKNVKQVRRGQQTANFTL